ncbi:hypothetical protein JAAARDRAFT_201773 [Jaapia argillacea MUCL 33604]|uniref:Uncharacterized protein n=1 Tax=Jaapia argillacea MUCL 33604 TaxID=933084 RepID=A0A067QLS2_9AGAM|nr:hypothetical protein JAAARDRAFT_201773 [Jaapia argillacea MUCL 33604]
MTIQSLKLLRGIIDDSISQLEAYYSTHSVDFPSLDAPYTLDAAELARSQPEVVQAVNALTAASYQLMTTVRAPFLTLFDTACAHQLSACLRVAEEINAAEFLREGGPAGRHIREIAAYSGLEPNRLGRILRLLATHHIFQEVKPDVFANNRISSYLDTGKPSGWLSTHRTEKYDGTPGGGALVGHLSDEVCKASSYIYETLTDPVMGQSFSTSHTPINQAFKTDKSFFPWLEEPFNKERFARYGAAIRGTSLWNSLDAVLYGYDWASLTPDDLIVDVGGGTGMPSMQIARAFPSARIVIQDRPEVVEQGKRYWSEVFPEAYNTGRVSFQVNDIFGQQPQTKASVFFVRTILHDWPDHEALKILLNLRHAAAPTTKLVIADYMIPYACPDDSDAALLPGAKGLIAPPPLLANLGKASSTAYGLDMVMFCNCNGQERTLAHFIDLAKQAHWRAIRLHRRDDNPFGFLVAEPM